MIDIIVGLLALIFIFFLPGFLLVLIVFPQRNQLSMEFDLLFKCVLGIALSILISIFVGILLDAFGMLGGVDEMRSLGLWVSMISITVVLGVVAWFIGGLRDLIMTSRLVGHRAAPDPRHELKRLLADKRALQDKLATLMGDEYQDDPELREEAEIRIPRIREDIERINLRIDEHLRAKECDGDDDRAE